MVAFHDEKSESQVRILVGFYIYTHTQTPLGKLSVRSPILWFEQYYYSKNIFLNNIRSVDNPSKNDSAHQAITSLDTIPLVCTIILVKSTILLNVFIIRRKAEMRRPYFLPGQPNPTDDFYPAIWCDPLSQITFINYRRSEHCKQKKRKEKNRESNALFEGFEQLST